MSDKDIINELKAENATLNHILESIQDLAKYYDEFYEDHDTSLRDALKTIFELTKLLPTSEPEEKCDKCHGHGKIRRAEGTERSFLCSDSYCDCPFGAKAKLDETAMNGGINPASWSPITEKQPNPHEKPESETEFTLKRCPECNSHKVHVDIKSRQVNSCGKCGYNRLNNSFNKEPKEIDVFKKRTVNYQALIDIFSQEVGHCTIRMNDDPLTNTGMMFTCIAAALNSIVIQLEEKVKE